MKFLGSKSFWAPKNLLGSKKVFGFQKRFWVPKKILVPKKFLNQKSQKKFEKLCQTKKKIDPPSALKRTQSQKWTLKWVRVAKFG